MSTTPTTKQFRLTDAIRERKRLAFASKYMTLTFPQRMKLAKSVKAIDITFQLKP
jgi:hypothetical protein